MEKDGENIPRRELPYAVEYSKGNVSCGACYHMINVGLVVIAARETTLRYSGLQDVWHHEHCFWKRLQKSKSTINEGLVRGLEWLKWEDQERFRNMLKVFQTKQSTNYFNGYHFSQFKIENSKSNRGICTTCQKHFATGELKAGLSSKWHHLHCIWPKEKKVMGSTRDIKGFDFLSINDQMVVNAIFEEIPKEKEEVPKEKEEVPVEQCPSRTQLKRPLPDEVICAEDHTGTSDPFDKKARLEKIKEERWKVSFKKQSDIQWELYQFFENSLKREDIVKLLEKNRQEVPADFDKQVERLVDCALFGPPCKCKVCHNGNMIYSTSHRTYVCCGYISEYTKCTHQDKNPQRSAICIPVEMMKNEKLKEMAQTMMGKLRERLYPKDEETTEQANSLKGMGGRAFVAPTHFEAGLHTKAENTVQIVKKGTVVEAEFTKAAESHVHTIGDVLMSAVLTMTDVYSNRNSYYNFKLLKHDNYEEFYIFRSWGRVGTKVGNSDYSIYSVESVACQAFEKLFHEKTGNEWKYRKFFQKVAGKMSYVETDYSEFESVEDVATPGSKSRLPDPIKSSIMAMFNVNSMKKTMKKFELDLERMPLGKLSHRQLMKAYETLSELEEILTNPGEIDREKILDVTNKFYTIIPHNFGLKEPLILDSLQLVKEKTKMIDSLLDIELVYSLKKQTSQMYSEGVDIVDTHYESLKCNMEVLDKSSTDYQMIMHYMTNTKGSTHEVSYELLDIIKVSRNTEAENFMSNLGNRKLLWHGSGIMNFAGILSQGLRIAPPEAPATGYMFGKGVYFADMFTKSSFYCKVDSGEAYLLLCDVALGLEKNESHAVGHSDRTIVPYHSVKGVGVEFPDPTADYLHMEGYIIPLGRPKKCKTHQSALLYNEYIVYNTKQIQLKYLVKVKISSARRIC